MQNLVARLGGDEFAILTAGMSDPADAFVSLSEFKRPWLCHYVKQARIDCFRQRWSCP